MMSCLDSHISVSKNQSQSIRQIYLYGENHGAKKVLDKEFDLWYDYYHNKGMRNLFEETPYYTAEFLNIWMRVDSDYILDAVYEDWKGSAAHNPDIKEFYKKIKSECPETIFFGTDVGHNYSTTGKRFLEYLESSNQKASGKYILTLEAIEQGKHYYSHSDNIYRENKMAVNFIREFEKLEDMRIMGIYGVSHVRLDALDSTNSVPCMGNQLKKCYGETVYSEDLSEFSKITEPYRIDSITVNGKAYEAPYFGRYDLIGLKDYLYWEFWRLENAYKDFRSNPKAGEDLPYNNYPMPIKSEQVFLIDCTKTDGSIRRMFYRSDGTILNGLPTTEEFIIK